MLGYGGQRVDLPRSGLGRDRSQFCGDGWRNHLTGTLTSAGEMTVTAQKKTRTSKPRTADCTLVAPTLDAVGARGLLDVDAARWSRPVGRSNSQKQIVRKT
jgi:hypothetical protein